LLEMWYGSIHWKWGQRIHSRDSMTTGVNIMLHSDASGSTAAGGLITLHFESSLDDKSSVCMQFIYSI
jgi:hypothetical protein